MAIFKGIQQKPCYDLIVDYHIDKILGKPKWQRGDVWPEKKRKAFYATLRTYVKLNETLTSCIVLYNIKGIKSGYVHYVSDGLQRILNLKNYFDIRVTELITSGHSKQESEDIARKELKAVYINVMSVEYDTEKEAKEDFIRINQGTALTPRDQTRVILDDLGDICIDYDVQILEKIHQAVQYGFSTMEYSYETLNKGKNKESSTYRDNYALFLKYLDEVYAKESYVQFNNIDKILEGNKKDILEQKLVDELLKYNLTDLTIKIAAFRKYMQINAGFLKRCWTKYRSEKNLSDKYLPAVGFTRWCFTFLLYADRNKIPVQKQEQFLVTLMTKSEGKTTIGISDNSTTILAKGNLTNLNALYRYTGIDITPIKRRARRSLPIAAGNDDCHAKSFRIYGEGKVFPDSAKINKSTGMKEHNEL